MVFSSVEFLFRFVPIFFLCYYLAPQRTKNFILFLGSVFFCAFGNPLYLGIILGCTLFSYFIGYGIQKYRHELVGQGLLCTFIVVQVGILAACRVGKRIDILEDAIPLGVIFFAMRNVSYQIDLFKDKMKHQRNILDFSVYLLFFPLLVAGPVTQYADLEEKLHSRKTNLEEISGGLKRFILGLGKEVLLAGQMNLLFQEIWGRGIAEISTLTAYLGIIGFALALYFHLSGYSDMAIGLGACLGFKVPENMNYPYTSVSLSDFFRRWFISVYNWLKEYVYIPLGGNRQGKVRVFIGMFFVWIISANIYGTEMHFMFWGAWLFICLFLEKLFLGRLLAHLPKIICHIYVLAVTFVAWFFFAVEQISDMWQYAYALIGMNKAGWYDSDAIYLLMKYGIFILVGIIGTMPLLNKNIAKLRSGNTGLQIALYRLGEKIFPAAILLLSVAYMVAV